MPSSDCQALANTSNSFGPTNCTCPEYDVEGCALLCGMVLLVSSQKRQAASEKQGADAVMSTWILATIAKAVKQKGMK